MNLHSPLDSKLFRTPDFQDEQNGVLLADASNIQSLLAHIHLIEGTTETALGRSITKPAENGLTDFHNGLIDLRTELQGLYDGIEAELDRRGVE